MADGRPIVQILVHGQLDERRSGANMAKHIFDGILCHSSRVSCPEQTGLDIDTYYYWIYLRSRAWTMLAPVKERTRVPLVVSFISARKNKLCSPMRLQMHQPYSITSTLRAASHFSCLVGCQRLLCAVCVVPAGSKTIWNRQLIRV